MIKKNKLSIFLLAVVAMLTVYYIKNPNSDEPNTIETSRYYQDERDDINNERETQILNLEEIISSKETNLTEKEKAINEMAILSSTTQNEIILEKKIISLGYNDCLVQIDNDIKDVNVSLLTKELSKEQFIEIAKIISAKCGNYGISLNYEAI